MHRTISPDLLREHLEQFLADAPQAVVLEDGVVLLDFRSAKYSISGEGKCVLHLWSEERNIVRRVIDAKAGNNALQLKVLRFGQAHPTLLEIAASPERRSDAARRASRNRYSSLLQRTLQREYPGFALERFTTGADLEHSLSPVYARGLLRAGQAAFAVLGVGSDETQASVDDSLTFAILWLDFLRQQSAGRVLVEGVKLFLPPGRAQVVQQRAAHLNPEAAKWQLYELHERQESTEPLDLKDTGNIISRLTRAINGAEAEERFSTSIQRIRALAPAAEVTVDSASEIVFRLFGLEFARARLAAVPGSFRSRESIVFGIGPSEYELEAGNQKTFCELLKCVTEQRCAGGSHTNMFFRLAPERWLESLVKRDVRLIDERLDGDFVYSQVPAFAASDRAMLDMLTCTIDGRLAVMELKVNDDIHLPLQGLDYWTRVRWHQQHGGFAANGYFSGRQLSSEPPLLYLVAPALHVHPRTDVLLRYLSPRIEWQLVQVDERWREGVRVVNRKHHPGFGADA